MNKNNTTNNSSTQNLMPINEIRNNTVILKNGSLRSIIEVDGINIDLMSNEDQENTLRTWQSFLNNLDFSVQILIVSRKANIDEYVSNVESKTAEVEEDLLKTQVNDYVTFIRDFTANNQIIDKKYYIIVPYDPFIMKKSAFGGQIKDMFLSIFNLNREAFSQDVLLDDKEFQKNYQQLIVRQDTILSQLQRMGLSAQLVQTNDIIPLIHNIYNPDTILKPTSTKEF